MDFKIENGVLLNYTGKEKEVVIPGNVTEIGDSAFSGCEALTAIILPNGVTEIGDSAFHSCHALTAITLPDGVMEIGDSAFYGCYALTAIALPDGVTTIGDYAFWNCHALTAMIIPNSVTAIADFTFGGCEALTAITIPDSVATIGNFAFSGCYGLTTITISDGVTEIGERAFDGCSSLINLVISESVKKIRWRAFGDCDALAVEKLPIHLWKTNQGMFAGFNNLTTFEIPDGIKMIKNGAFQDCQGLLAVTIPNTVTSIGSDTFSGCNKLSDVTIPESVEKIGKGAFSGCASLTSLVIPRKVKNLDERVFLNCIGLRDMTIPTSVKSLGAGTFSGCDGLTQIKALGVTKIDKHFANESVAVICPKVAFPTNETPALKIQYTLGYLSAPELYSDEIAANCTNYLTGQRKRILMLAIEKGWMSPIRYYMSNKLITAGIIQEAIEIAQKTENTELVAMLLDYRNKNIGNNEMEQQEEKEIKKAFAEPKAPTLSKLWKYEKQKDETYCLNKYKGGETEITVPSMIGKILVTKIYAETFAGCNALTAITISDRISEISSNAFSNCASLRAIVVDTNNAKYASIDGVLFNKSKKNLLRCPEGKQGTFLIPKSVKTIDNGAFTGCASLTEVTIPKNVTKIGNYAFGDCKNLVIVTDENSCGAIYAKQNGIALKII